MNEQAPVKLKSGQVIKKQNAVGLYTSAAGRDGANNAEPTYAPKQEAVHEGFGR